MTYRSLAALPVLLVLAAQPARAATDWSLAAATWKEQLADLYVVDAARRLCGLPVSAPAQASLRSTIQGLEQALGASRKAARAAERNLVTGAGGARKFCADPAMVAKAKATQQSLQATLLATGGNISLPYQPAQQAAQQTSQQPALSPTMPTPVVDPDIALIQGCRKAAVARTGSGRAANGAFWTQYEHCVADQGAGWY